LPFSFFLMEMRRLEAHSGFSMLWRLKVDFVDVHLIEITSIVV